jgi:hypothetical protein
MKSGFAALGRLHMQAILLLAAVFAIGVVGGVALDRALGGHGRPPHPGGPPRGGLPPDLREGLNLTPDQEERIMDVLDRNRPRTDAVLDEFVPRLRAVTDSVRAEIREILSSEQRELFDRRQPRLLGEEGRPPFPGGPPPGPGPR